MTDVPSPSPSSPPPPEPRPEVPVLPAEQLFRGGREVCIELGGALYRLRITRRGKLILQK